MATPTRAKRQFGAFLAELRERAHLDPADAGAELRKSVSTINRWEAGTALVRDWGPVRTLLQFYGATGAELDEGARLWQAAKEEPPAVRLPSAVPRDFHELVTAEREAVRERTLAPYVLPALLQTENYARALVRAAHRFYDQGTRQDDVIATRMRRQRLLGPPDPLILHAVIDEAAIRRSVGGPDVMREQLAHLLVVAAKPNITVQVIPFSLGAYGTMNGSCVVIDYPDAADAPGVYLEYPAGGAWVDNVEDVKRFTTMFDDVSALALSPTDTTDLILQQIRALRTP
ncbi:MAG TPA: helix-turn-helix transcriptional regulator [Actinophytocola sp.]|uniref:helix-turn-helix domain-containing protein n=1 Tax=Actinophytocola sp. TaxID=1872138 RepID=UPI002DDCFE24|nr:helix-turn-helix transcriptional regulator [Actinophytocola sp.]HEV2779234.1 helix-turn-helix transcriptional regulator [Actinophytocola sp.]